MSLILRWTIGIQDTTRLDAFEQESDLYNIIWLAKLSIISFQKWFSEARFLLFYNGENLSKFKEIFNSVELSLLHPLEIIDQTSLLGTGKFKNPYHFTPQGVWWKWVPFRFDENCNEISIDTDIICINKPADWHQWLEGKKEIIVAPERFSEILVNTCGDFHAHPILKNKSPLNCGIVGHRKGFDFSERFFEITKEIKYGETHNSLFITEQGAINVWAYSLELEMVKFHVLDFERCCWIRDFLYYLEKGVSVETIHATTWHKQIAKSLRVVLEKRILEDSSDEDFLSDILEVGQTMSYYSRHLFRRQMGEDKKSVEFFF